MQTKLSTNTNGELILIKEIERDVGVVYKGRTNESTEVHITSLPEEILREIFIASLAADRRHSENESIWRDSYNSALAISRVSKLFHRVVQPLLYSSVQFENPYNDGNPGEQISLLHRTLIDNPQLGSLCKDVKLCNLDTHMTMDMERFMVVEKLLGLMPSVRSLAILGGLHHPQNWPIMERALKTMVHLKNLLIGTREDIPNFEIQARVHTADIYDAIKTLHLDRLDLSWVSGREGISWHDFSKKEFEKSSTITTIQMAEFYDDPRSLKALLSLPKALKHFELRTLGSDMLTYKNLGPSLLEQHKSLESIRIAGVWRMFHSGDLNLMKFSRLEALTLSCWEFKMSPEAVCSELLPPSVRTFIWHVGSEKPGCMWGGSQRQWLLEFVKIARVKRPTLRHIKIDFHAHNTTTTRDVLYHAFLQWRRLDEAGDIIRRSGIEFLYSENWSNGRTPKSIQVEREADWEEVAKEFDEIEKAEQEENERRKARQNHRKGAI